MTSVFDHTSYKTFLRAALSRADSPELTRSRLAAAIGCKPAFVSLVLNGHSHFTLEHGPLIAEFLKLTHPETRFFMLLLQLERSGTEKLRSFFSRQLDELMKSRNEIKNRVAVQEEVPEVHKALFYSSWHYAAIHVLISIPAYSSSPSEIARRLKLSRIKVEQVLNDLIQMGLVKRTAKGLRMTSNRIHLPSESAHVLRHHTNWRLEAIDSLNEHVDEGVHFSYVLAVSKGDIERMKTLLLETIQSVESIVRRSPEEELACLNIDLFQPRQ